MQKNDNQRKGARNYQPYVYYDSPLVRGQRAAVPRSTGSSHAPKPPKLKAPKKRHTGLLIFVVLLAVSGLIGYNRIEQHRRAVADAKTRASVAAENTRQTNIASFADQVNAVISGNPGITFSVTATDIDTGKTQSFGSSQPFVAASTAKLLTAAAYYNEVENGKLSLTQTIDGQSAQYLLQQMIVVSDDTAWAELNDTLGHAELSAYARTLGITDYNATDNLLGSGDIANILQKLYTGKLMNTAHQQQLLGWMKQANYRDFIIPAVPSGDTVYHKVGEVDDNVHDAAIITNGKHTLVLVIFTNGNGTYEWENRAKLFQLITKAAVQDYLGS